MKLWTPDQESAVEDRDADGLTLSQVDELVDELTGDVSLHAGQLAFYLSTETAKVTIGLAGIRGGKTHAGGFTTLMYAIEHPCAEDEMHLVCSPTFPMSKVPVEKLFKLLYDKTIFPVCPLIKYVKSERLFLLAAANGGITRIKIVSLHDPDKIRGLKALSAWLDEAAYITRDAWDIVQGRLADVDGPCWITTTPAGYNWVYEEYEKAVAQRNAGIPLHKRSHRVIHWRSTDNVFVKRSGFERLAGQFDARTFAQEVEAKFVKLAGLVYHAFSKTKNMKAGRIDPRLPLLVGQDFNVTMMASSFSQPFTTASRKPGLHIVHERLQPDSDTPALAAYLDRFTSEHRIPKRNVTIYPDASGKARSTTGRSDHLLLRDAGYRVISAMKNPLVKDRVNCVNGLLHPMYDAHTRLLVDPACRHHIDGFTKQIYKPLSDPPEPDKEHGLDHTMDANGYTCWAKFPLRTAASLGLTTTQIRKAA